MTYPNVSPGDPIRRETAARYNAINDLLNRVETPPEHADNFNGNIEITVRNKTDKPLPAFAPVAITGIVGKLTDDMVLNEPVYEVGKATPESKHVAVVQNLIPVNGIGSALVIGVTPAKVKINSEADQYAAVAPDGTLTSASDGLLRILACNKATDWAWLQLGGGGGGSAAGYTGYFKLVLESQPVSDEPGANVDYYVNIVDGATYDAEQNPVSGKSVCKVNNVTYRLDPYRSGMIAETSIFALKYTAPVAADPDAGTEAQAAKVEIVNLAEEGRSYLPSDTSENCWYQLGRAIVSANEDGTLNVAIQQDHQGTATNGIPQIWWYALCED